ncbi:hypothetical protein Dimus_003557 [Dionaea muscipula]
MIAQKFSLNSPASCYGYKLRNNVVRHYSHSLVIYLLSKTCYVFLMQHRKQLVTASYVDDSLLKLDSDAKCAGVTILSEMGLDPGIDHMMAMKMINQAYLQGGKVQSFSSYCGGLPSPAAANNPLLENLEKPTYEIFTSKLVGI